MLEQYLILSALVVLAVLMLQSLLFLILKNADKAALAAAVLVTCNYCWIAFLPVAKIICCGFPIDDLVILFLYLLLSANAVFVLLKYLPCQKLRGPLDALSLILLAITSFPIVKDELDIQAKNAYIRSFVQQRSIEPKLVAPKEKPDIYFIVADAFANQHILSRQYKYESPLPEFLKNRGFFVADLSTSVHDRTRFSLASTLNLRYMDDLCREPNLHLENFFRIMQNNLVARSLQKLGYKYLNAASGWEATDFNIYAQENLAWAPLGNFYIAFYRLTALSAFESHFHLLSSLFKAGRTSSLKEASSIARMPGPKFVFMHSLLTHSPYFLDENGKTLPLPAGMLNEPCSAGPYLEQLKFTEKQIMLAIDAILANSASKPIIILESDHGPNSLACKFEPDYLNERMHILAAFYLPGPAAEPPPRDISALNTFVYIFNRYFGSKLKTFERKSFACAPYDAMDSMKDVSGFIEDFEIESKRKAVKENSPEKTKAINPRQATD